MSKFHITNPTEFDGYIDITELWEYIDDGYEVVPSQIEIAPDCEALIQGANTDRFDDEVCADVLVRIIFTHMELPPDSPQLIGSIADIGTRKYLYLGA